MRVQAVYAWTMKSVTLKSGYDGTGADMAGKVTLDMPDKAKQLHLLWKPNRKKESHHSLTNINADCLHSSTAEKSPRAAAHP